MATTRPFVLPDTFNGSGDSNWTEWKFHFDNVASGWDEANQLKWLKVRLTCRAQTAFQHLSAENQATFALATAALKERFEPATRKHRYQAELQARKKRKGESWADFADDLKSIADKAYPDLEEKASSEQLLGSAGPPSSYFWSEAVKTNESRCCCECHCRVGVLHYTKGECPSSP